MQAPPTSAQPPRQAPPLSRREQLLLHLERVRVEARRLETDEGADRDRRALLLELRDAERAVFHYDLSRAIDRITDPEERARQLMSAAVADGSHVAAGRHEAAYQALRGARLAREQADAEAAADQQTPAEALTALVEHLLTLGDRERRVIHDALAPTVHVYQPPAPVPPEAVPVAAEPPAPSGPTVATPAGPGPAVGASGAPQPAGQPIAQPTPAPRVRATVAAPPRTPR
jgi:hypothetical protein